MQIEVTTGGSDQRVFLEQVVLLYLRLIPCTLFPRHLEEAHIFVYLYTYEYVCRSCTPSVPSCYVTCEGAPTVNAPWIFASSSKFGISSEKIAASYRGEPKRHVISYTISSICRRLRMYSLLKCTIHWILPTEHTAVGVVSGVINAEP